MKAIKLLTSFLFILGFLAIPFTNVTAEQEVRVLVKYKEGTDFNAQSTENSKLNIETILVPKSETERVIKRLEQQPYIEYAEVDQPVFAQSLPPNDPLYINQREAFEAIRISEAWGKYLPKEEVTVAIVDSGINLNHPDLNENLVEGINLVNRDEPPMDFDGHGTHVAGLVGAVTNNSIGISSAAKRVMLMPIKVFENRSGYMSTVIEGILYAVDNGADIINLSLGSYNNMQSLVDVIDYAESKDVLVVGAAGNDNADAVVYPAAYPEVIGVASTDTVSGGKASFSNYGKDVSVAAPGTNIYSTWIDGYQSMDGTSMSTPIVSSLAAMLKQQAPFLTSYQIKSIIESTAEPLPVEYSLGKGLIDASDALDYIETKNRLGGATSVETSVEISRSGWSTLSNRSIDWKGSQITGTFVILASGDQFPDSLAASPLASYLDSPILLVKNDKFSEAVKKEITRLNPTHVLVMGGKSAIGTNVETELNAMGVEPIRIAGQNRYETAISINGIVPYITNKAFVVSGENYPDALSIAAYSGINQYPILFTKKDQVPKKVEDFIKKNQITKTYVIGGEKAVSESVMKLLPNPYRVFGEDRYDTNFRVHQVFGVGLNTQKLLFATGGNFPDALTAGPLANKSNSPVILVNENKVLELEKSTNLFRNGDDYNILGGVGAISTRLAWTLDQYIQQNN